MARMWMVRSDGGSLYEVFRERGVVAIGFSSLAPHAKLGMDRKQLAAKLQSIEPQMKPGAVISGASQVWRFLNEFVPGDWVTTYSPANRVYLVGKITGPAEHLPESEPGLTIARKVQWERREVVRDALSASARNSLGSTLTLFEVPGDTADELLAALKDQPSLPTETAESIEISTDTLVGIEEQAREGIKDIIVNLGWRDMQELVAGILRAMGYKTQVSPDGSDRGKDIVASPDGFGFEHPRIVVEVKHRKGQMGSQDIRSFLGGRHKDDRGLYVSTGGFSKDALYEADRASIPLAMWTLEHVVRALIEHYEATDAETKRIVPLKRLYWPA